MSPPSPVPPTERQMGGIPALFRPSRGRPGPPVLLLHGYGGDEMAMWVFAQAIPPAQEVYALRGIYPAEEGGYRWHEGRRWPPPPAATLDNAVEALRGAVQSIDAPDGVVWMGFSQGAAVAFRCAASGLPTLGVASLAGYLPEGGSALAPGLPVFWGHGLRDDRVPVQAAREAVSRLRSDGAAVDYCESDVGHKLGAACFRALKEWIERTAPDR